MAGLQPARWHKRRNLRQFAAILAVAWFGVVEPQAKAATTDACYVLEPSHWDTFYGKADRLYLTGYWKFKPVVNALKQLGNKVVRGDSTTDPGTDAGIENGYFRPDFDDSSWDALPVPWVWNTPLKANAQDKPDSVPFAGVGYFRTRFQVPADRSGKRVVIHFASVQTDCRVWVNGELVGTHANSQSEAGPPWSFDERLWLDDFDFDITKLVRFGAENVVAVRVYDDGLPILYDRHADGGGICGPVTVEFREPVYASEILVDPNITTGEISMDVLLFNHETAPRTVKLQARVEPFTSAFYQPSATAPAADAELGEVSCPPGESRHCVALRVADPVLWDVNDPFLYHLRLTSDGKLLGQTRFGFRKFEVRGNKFYLNGHPIHVLGANPGDNWNRRPQIFCFNKANALRLGLKLYKEANLTFVRVHNGPRTEIFYDICDELGLIVQNDFSPHYDALKQAETKRAEMIAQVQVASYVNPDGSLTEAFRKLLGKWFNGLYNHPANCMFTAGNELGYNQVSARAGAPELVAYMNGFYEFLKRHDGQKRPVTPSAGLAVWDWRTPLEADYLDHHTYIDADLGWADCVTGNMKPVRDWERIYGKPIRDLNKPVINGETVGYQTRACFGQKATRELFADGKLDKAKYVSWASTIAKDAGRSIGYWDYGAQHWYVCWAGVRSLATLESTQSATAYLTGNMVHMLRRDMDFLQGFFLHDLCPQHFGLDYGFYAGDGAAMHGLYAKAKSHVEFLSLQRSLAPQLVTLDMVDRHWFAGDTLQTSIHVINDAFRDDGKGYTTELALETVDGKEVNTAKLAFDTVPEGGRSEQAVTLALDSKLPAADYRLRLRLRKAERVVNEQEYPIFIGSRERSVDRVTQRRVALYDTAPTLFRGLGPAATAPVLRDLGVPFTAVSDLADLTKFDLLVVGTNSIDQNLMNQASKVREWLERGGRVLCLEQVYAGPVPFLSEMRLQFCGNMFVADVIEPDHPVVRGSRPWHWELWNGNREKIDGAWDAGPKRVYDTYLLPMTEGVVVAGAPRSGGWCRNLVFGMVASEVKAGDGLVFFSQALAVQRYGKDPVATRYLRDLFGYVLGEEWRGQFAVPVAGRRVSFLDRAKCFTVDLRNSANRGFADDVDGDQQGGWTDQGKNDLRTVPRGDVTFMGVPYSILDDAGGKPACLVLFGQKRPYFPKAIEGIKIGRKASQLHFLHAVAWGGGKGTKAAEYRVRYEDGTIETLALTTGDNIGEWWSPADAKQAAVAWTDRNPAGAMVGVYGFAWTNSHPEKVIVAIDFVSGETDAVPALVAITGVTE